MAHYGKWFRGSETASTTAWNMEALVREQARWALRKATYLNADIDADANDGNSLGGLSWRGERTSILPNDDAVFHASGAIGPQLSSCRAG